MAIGGPISVDLSFSVNAKDTDFFATIIDIDPKGVARIIGQPGKIDLKYRNGNDKPELLEPGKAYTVHIDLWDTAHQFPKGHQIGLYIRSELFPAYARNLNTWSQSRRRPARFPPTSPSSTTMPTQAAALPGVAGEVSLEGRLVTRGRMRATLESGTETAKARAAKSTEGQSTRKATIAVTRSSERRRPGGNANPGKGFRKDNTAVPEACLSRESKPPPARMPRQGFRKKPPKSRRLA